MNIPRKRVLLLAIAAVGMITIGCQSMMRGMGMIPMGGGDDVEFSEELWKVLAAEDYVGASGKTGSLYKGTPPHGKVLELFHKKVTVRGHNGLAIVKRNYGGEGVSIDEVKSDRAAWLKAVTVMFKREDGYDGDNKNWFWAKYKPDGSLHTMSKMMMSIPLAGRVAKGKDKGCIKCHGSAPGGDYIFATDISE